MKTIISMKVWPRLAILAALLLIIACGRSEEATPRPTGYAYIGARGACRNTDAWRNTGACCNAASSGSNGNAAAEPRCHGCPDPYLCAYPRGTA